MATVRSSATKRRSATARSAGSKKHRFNVAEDAPILDLKRKTNPARIVFRKGKDHEMEETPAKAFNEENALVSLKLMLLLRMMRDNYTFEDVFDKLGPVEKDVIENYKGFDAQQRKTELNTLRAQEQKFLFARA